MSSDSVSQQGSEENTEVSNTLDSKTGDVLEDQAEVRINENNGNQQIASINISLGSNSPIKLGMSKEEIDQILGLGIADENLLYEFYDYNGVRVTYRNNLAAYIVIDSHPTNVVEFSFDTVNNGISPEELINNYGPPSYSGIDSYGYFVFEDNDKLIHIPDTAALDELRKNNFDNTKLYVVDFFTSIEKPDYIHKVTIQDYKFVEEQNKKITKE